MKKNIKLLIVFFILVGYLSLIINTNANANSINDVSGKIIYEI